MFRRTRPNVFGLALALSSTACGSSTEAVPTPGSLRDASVDAADETPPATPSDPIVLGCDPPCPAGQTCGVTRICLEPGGCAVDGDCTDGKRCDPNGQCVVGGECGGQEVKLTSVAPNLLLVLDRSCSMQRTVGALSKWELAVRAVVDLTTKFDARFRFGLSLFPDSAGDRCTQEPMAFLPASGNEAKIAKLLTDSLSPTDPNYPSRPCVTNIDAAILQARDTPLLRQRDRKSSVILITDGAQAGCDAAGGSTGTIAYLKQLARNGIKTFVVGFGAEISGASLTKYAEAGGAPAPNAEKFFRAEDGPALAAVLSTIAREAVSCRFSLASKPADPSKIFVFFDDKREVPRDVPDGWVYDPADGTITFQGTSCDDLRTEKVKDVDVVFGCRSAVPS
jgi:hypothetical protein